ncbi:SO_0444 family Cu/Zn efflux transporter [Halodesulfovibrio spirochaetisodalis]|uniref:Permease n=1 Tax=Halodesulfovibrio spirochaetisodalis TaxID=1560234 RepID=A0A1B7XG66_9BACT|nr:SO_0444 family Cu/Zn efflux transporter [Halodesulfovibrio spirochaetisodalis]OBQ54516.1 permease [Halodesulfovibrio spirochaetisodalis]
MEIAIQYITEVWEILLEAAPYVLFGFFVAGLLKGFLPEDFVARHLGSDKKGAVLKASMFGVPLPLCSCGVIPAAAGLRQQGASKGATTSFMISTPETGVDSIAITYALLDPIMTIVRPVAAFISALTAGTLVDMFPEKPKPGKTEFTPLNFAPTTLKKEEECTSGCCSSSAGKRFKDKFMTGMKFAFGELVADIGKWLFIGILIAAVVSTFLPVTFFQDYVGDGLLSMILMVVIGVPMYVCATASTPIAAALALKGLSPGGALVFLLVGPATNAATITVVAQTLGKRVAFIYVSSIAVTSVILGLAVNWLYAKLGLSVFEWINNVETHQHGIIAYASAIALIILVGKQFVGRGGQKHGASCGCH